MSSGHGVSFAEAVRVWVRVAAQSFGGPAGQIAVMHRIVVGEKRWIGESRFLHALNYCMLLPGPEAQQLATYLGWLLHGVRGGLVAGALFVLPGFLSILGLSLLYAGYHEVGWVAGLLFGVKAAVLAVVVEAVERIGKRVLTNRVMVGVAALGFAAIFLFGVPFPVVVLAAGCVGLVGNRVAPASFLVLRAKEAAGEAAPAALDAWLDARPTALPPVVRTAGVLALGVLLWLGPIAGLAAALGRDHVFVSIGWFFAKAAVVTFGGAYSVLAYVAQEAVERQGWLLPGEMLDGLGMAETTPGPLVQVVQFVGFLGAWRAPGALPPWVSGTIGAVVATWVTFVPSFVWIFAGAPYMEWLRGRRALTAALSTITAAVVGVVLNLAVWLSLHVIFSSVGELAGPLGVRLPIPVWSTVDPLAVVIAVGALVATLRFHVGMLPLLAVSALVGMVARGW